MGLEKHISQYVFKFSEIQQQLKPIVVSFSYFAKKGKSQGIGNVLRKRTCNGYQQRQAGQKTQMAEILEDPHKGKPSAVWL